LRDSIKITNKTRHLLAFERYDWISKLKCIKNIKIDPDIKGM